MTKWTLLSAFISGATVTIKGVTGVISSVEREDGSGSSFNVTLYVGRDKQTVYLRTQD